MKIIQVQKNYKSNSKGVVATVGFFDGVHAGHRHLISQLKQIADKEGLPAAVITFPLHPQGILNPTVKPSLLTSPDEKLEYLDEAGANICFIIDFTSEFSCLDAENFIKNILHKQLNVQHLIIGYDHRFGRNREDGFDEYSQYGAECEMKVSRAEELEGEHISSTIIRRMLLAGCVEEANIMLSYSYAISGKVVHGNHLGRTIGFPTANLKIDHAEKLIPGTGIYVANIMLGAEYFRGMAYIGTRPTVSHSGEQHVEVHILNFDREIYGETLRLEFVRFIREDRAFKNLEELREQLIKDRDAVLLT
ncbi:MAG: riboflavin biosynthesis protein RibF [Dysgonamonadaceae bacterium]|jgi:riboflavin kinase/FMN adenylyltransferase|nr:riboflavin biosynthesis protein RibF [Dysgonamonadaceae bacterium]